MLVCITIALLSGCAGIPDADTGVTVHKQEACEVVVRTDTARRCVSRESARDILRQVLQ